MAALATAGLLAVCPADPRALPERATPGEIGDALLLPALPGHRAVTAALVWRPDNLPGCGCFLFETEMVFADLHADGAVLRVLVPCADMPRARYSRSAGDAEELERGGLYRLELTRAFDVTADKHGARWRAERIDVVPAASAIGGR